MVHHLLILGIIGVGFLVAVGLAVVDYRRYKRKRKDVLRVEGYLPRKAVDSLQWPATTSPWSRRS